MSQPLDMQLARRIDTWGGLLLCALLFAWSRLRARLGGPRQPPLRATTPPGPSAPAVPRPRRVLAIKFYGLGNIVMLLPVLGALRRAWPDVEIDFMTMSGNRALLERSGAADRVIGVDVDGIPALARSLGRALRTLRSRRYDVVIDFEQFVKLSTILGYLSGARERIGFNTDGQRRGWLYTTRVVYTDGEHMSQIFMRLLRPFGIDTTPAPACILTKPEDDARAEKLLTGNGVDSDHFPVVVVHVGSGPNFYRVPLKRWPPESFATLCDGLVERFGAVLVFTGKGDEERTLTREVMGRMKYEGIDACDRLGVMELTALLKRCHLTIVNDTSVMHISAAVRTPVVAFFGPTSPAHYGPGGSEDLVFYRDLYCSPCLTNYNLKVSRCADPICIRSIAPEDVLRAIEERFLRDDAPLRAYLERRA
ncbi:MAG: glycosyltransferase family 9 protein [Myxococcota bacterium]